MVPCCRYRHAAKTGFRRIDHEEDGDVELSPEVTDSDGSIRYLCRTPSPVSVIDIVDESRDLARRTIKRIKKHNAQRLSTKASMMFASVEGMTLSSPMPLGMSLVKNRSLARPVLEPSVFKDDNDGGWTVVRRRHRPPVITGNVHDSNNANCSKFSDISGVGLARLRASPTKYPGRGNPSAARNRFSQRVRSDGDLVPRQARVGDSNAGHAFRKLLGFVWRKKEPGEPVWRRHDFLLRMNGDGGRGGFNPGRGNFSAGRGGFQGRTGYQGHGYQGRGGFQGRHGIQGRGNAAPRGRQGTGRGGHHAYQGTSDLFGLGSGSNFVQGESSSMGGTNNDNQRQSWAANYQRNNGYTSGNNGGFGGHHQRWQGDRAYQYRPRDNSASMQSRSGIDADLLQQIVQAVVAAVTAATKVTDPTPGVPLTTALTGGTGQHTMTSVAMSNAAPQATHEIQDNQGTVAKTRDNEGQGPQKKKKEEKSGCFRCKQPGHHIDDCPTPYCDLCESVHHATHACHLHQAPKPTAILHGYANEALMFFELACGAFKAKVENPRLAKIIVEGDAMTIPELIDPLKKIVPSEKFNWEVFHFKENIYRFKLPSKQEVQRLKNLGTYICNDRESCLVFDIWSSLEEPMYLLPEVWVRVAGLPSDIISDYLSLWGVGTLFGKTLDVDMAFTRKNKVLRTKIGCLDSRLIPKDSDMFIRRGFLKLFFEVEEDNGNQEVDMVEVNNGGDGNDDASNGEHNKEGGNAMDMDPKGKDETNNSNNGGQDGAFMSDGVQGMQLAQSEINIGAIKVPLSPSGISTWGLPQVFSGSAASSGSELESSQSGVHHVLSASARVLPADGTQAGEPESATCEHAVLTVVKERSAVDTDAVVDGTEMRLLAQKICTQELPASGLAPLQGTVEQTTSGGSSTPVQTKLSATTVSRPQKIVSASTAWDQAVSNNHWPIDGQSLQDQAAAARGSSTHVAPVAHGNVGDPSTMGALDLAQETEGEEFKLHGGDGKLNSDDPNRVGIALPLRDIVNPTIEEVIAFGVADVLERWDLEDTPDMEDKILKIAKERYRGWRSTLHSTYKAYNIDAARMANETSQKNSDNRKKQKAIHRVGSKSYSQLSFEKRDLETGEEPDCIALWELTHTKNGIWSNRESQDVYDKACEEVNLKEGETNGPVSTEDRNNIFQTNYKTTMGCKSSQPRGYGYMAKPPRPADRFRFDLEEQSRASQRQNAELNQQVTQLQDELQAERENTQQQLELERAERQRLEERLQEDRIERERLLEEERRSRQLELQAVQESFMKKIAEMTEMMGTQQTLAQQIAPRRNGKENTNPNVSRSLFQTPSTNAAPGKKNMIPPNQLAAAAKLNTRIFRAMDGNNGAK
ncbi:hypothetical protein ACQ4PT_067689 [Festuca glaucescens]